MFVFFGNWRRQWAFPCSDFLRWSFVKFWKEQSRVRESEQLIYFSLTLGLLHQPLKAATSASLRTISCPLQDVFKTPRKGNWWPDQVFRDYGVVYAISITSKQWKHLIVFESFSQRYSREVQHYRVDVIAGDANAAAYKYYKKQEYQDLHNSSVAVMLRQVQREVNMDRPFESRLQIDCSTNNHSSQLRSTNYPDCCFMALLSCQNRLNPEFWEDSGATRVSVRRVKRRNKLRTALIPRVLKLCSEKHLGRAFQIWKILAIRWLHLKTTKFSNPNESWSFRTKISRYDPQIYPGTLLFLCLFGSCPSKLPWKVTCEAWSQGRSQEAEDSEK